MLTKLFVAPVIAALLLTGTAYAVSLDSGQSAQLPQKTTAVSAAPQLTERAAAQSTQSADPADPVRETVSVQTPAETTAPAQSAQLTREQAAELALKHAGLTADQVQALRTEAELYERIPHYDVEFRAEDWEYEYEIHAETGEILKSHREYDPVKTAPAPTAPPAQQPTESTEAPARTTYLTAQEALALALAHAGLTQDAIRFPQTEFDWDDGAPQWNVEFRVDCWEYSYEIHAETGKILEFDKDWDD